MAGASEVLRSRATFAVFGCLALLSACSRSSGGSGASSSTAVPGASVAASTSLVLQVGPDVAPSVRARLETLVKGATSRPFEVRAAGASISDLGSGAVAIAVGDTATTRLLINATDVQALPSEGFLVRSRVDASGVTLLTADGVGEKPDTLGLKHNTGAAFGAYALLEELGFAFLHPLAPTTPSELELPAAPLSLREEPRWPVRGTHLHTMHPIELTDLLNGWGKTGTTDAAGFAAMLPEWDLFLEWCVANRQNRVEWMLLWAKSWGPFADGPVRQARLKTLCDRAHAFGVGIGVDVPLALEQQHSQRLVRQQGNLANELQQIRDGIDWVLAAGFDFMGTETGTSEFTHPDPAKMLAWMNEFARHLDKRGKHGAMKAHCSQGQVAKGYPDPRTGQPINFNFLPYHADPKLGVMAHTVQHYALDDPAPTYGNTDFGYMRDYMRLEAGRREVVWFPETAYWVSFDVDVPLFLPVYCERRVRDLRLIAEDERSGRMKKIQGQMNFSSGWEWGYWLNDVVTARAAWQPFSSEPTDQAALARHLAPILRCFGAAATEVSDLIQRTAAAERELLIEGRVAGKKPASIRRRNGQAYLQGWETWDDVSGDVGKLPGVRPIFTQPEKLGLVEMRSPSWLTGAPDYATEIQPLLAEMAQRFQTLADEWPRLASKVSPRARPLFDELSDAARMTALRAKQVHGLYDYVHRSGTPAGLARLKEARTALDDAQVVVARREKAYRVEADRIAAWSPGPTAYEFRYLWTVRSLHFWWRDEGKAVDAPFSPAYLNVIDPLDVAKGEGFWLPLAQTARALGQVTGASWFTDLLANPPKEPKYPPAGLRSRP